jgi:D-xylose transport system ATP-binding protein
MNGGSVQTKPVIEIVEVVKNFGGIHALKGVSLSIFPGEVVALVGHNGAGKSVLVQIVSGVFAADEGSIRVDGQLVHFRSPADARNAAIETIYQTLALADNLDAPANFFLGRELRKSFGFLDKKRMAEVTASALTALNPQFTEIKRPVREMSGGQRQAIAIARAVHFKAKCLIMDEPTAALGPHETAQVGELILRLRDKGLGILVVSHDVRDVLRLADRIAVLKSGILVGIVDAADANEDVIVDMIIRGHSKEPRH